MVVLRGRVGSVLCVLIGIVARIGENGVGFCVLASCRGSVLGVIRGGVYPRIRGVLFCDVTEQGGATRGKLAERTRTSTDEDKLGVGLAIINYLVVSPGSSFARVAVMRVRSTVSALKDMRFVLRTWAIQIFLSVAVRSLIRT